MSHQPVNTAELERSNPARSPAWRWNRALEIVAQGAYATRQQEDDATRAAVKFIRKLNKYASARGVRAATRQSPSLAMAWKIYNAGGPTVLEIKLRVLARQSSPRIGELMGIPMHVIETFKELFLDIEDRINAKSYIREFVAGMPVTGLPSDECLALLIAYHHGPCAVEVWLDYFAHRDETHDLATPQGRQRESIALFIAAQQLSAHDEQHKLRLVCAVLSGAVNRLDSAKPCRVSASLAAKVRGQLRQMPWKSAAMDGGERRAMVGQWINRPEKPRCGRVA